MTTSTANTAKLANSSNSVTPLPVLRVAVSGQENSGNPQSDAIEQDKLQVASSKSHGVEHPGDSVSASERWIERRQWQGVQTKFNRSSPEDGDVSKLFGLYRFKANSVTPLTDNSERNSKQKSFGLEQFCFRVGQKDVSDPTTRAAVNATATKDNQSTLESRATNTVVFKDCTVSPNEDACRELQPKAVSTPQEDDSSTKVHLLRQRC